MKIKVFVLPDGTICCRHSDELAAALKLKPLNVRRITTIDWSPHTQLWVAKTTTGKALVTATSRKMCVDFEETFIDRLLRQFFMCWQPDTSMLCPDCKARLGRHIHLTCPACGFEFPMAQEGFNWKDFNLSHLVSV